MINIILNSHSLLIGDLTIGRKEEGRIILSLRGKASLSVSKLGEEAGRRGSLSAKFCPRIIFLQVGSIQYNPSKRGRRLLEMGTWWNCVEKRKLPVP